jgi:trimethylamine--corrinoid protein Co-methyltransferase
MARAQVRFLASEERTLLYEQTLTVLDEVGVVVRVPEVLDLMTEAGAVVDREHARVRLPRDLVERCLKTVPASVLLAARDPANDVVVGEGGLSFTSDGTATYVLDDETGERHEGSAADLRTIMRLFDALPNVDYVWPSISARDVDPVTANLEIEAISFRSCAKHVQDEVRAPEYVAPLLDMIAAIAGAPVAERPIFSAINCTIAPLQHDTDMTKASLALARAGVPIVIMPMPLTGTTAPMSIAGNAVVTLAEILSAVVIFQVAAPGCPLIAAPEPGAADLRSGLYLCGAPEATLAMLAGVEMCVHLGLPCQGPGFGGDAKAADHQEGAEGMSAAMIGALSGADTLVGVGTLDGAQMISLAKIVLDDDAAGLIKTLVGDVTIDAGSTLLDDIRAVGPGGHFMGRRSTRERGRGGGIWRPSVYRRGTFDSHRGRSLVDDALAQARELLATHEVKPLDDDVERHIDAVIAGFKSTHV